MKRRIVKNIVAMALCLATILSSFSTVFAGTIPSQYDKEMYKTNGTVDYEKVHSLIFQGYDATAPKAKFEVHVGHGTETMVYESDTGVIEVNIGDTLTFVNASVLGSGDDWEKCDFQVSDGATVKSTTSISDINKTLNEKIDTSETGTYHVYLNIMDNEDVNNNLDSTEGWGNWSYSGTHHVIGLNPVAGTGSGFDCWWYYSKMTIKIVNNPPTSDFTIEYQGSDVTDKKTNPVTVDPGDKSLVLRDKSEPFSADEPITGRKWSYWDVDNGWKEISGSANKTIVTISDMDSSLPGSGQNKAFKLVCTSSSGGVDFEEHTAYFNKVLNSGYIIYYRDEETDRDIYPAKERPGLGFGSYVEKALAAPANSTLITPSPTTIILDAANTFTTFTFYYRFSSSPANAPPLCNFERTGYGNGGKHSKGRRQRQLVK